MYNPPSVYLIPDKLATNISHEVARFCADRLFPFAPWFANVGVENRVAFEQSLQVVGRSAWLLEEAQRWAREC